MDGSDELSPADGVERSAPVFLLRDKSRRPNVPSHLSLRGPSFERLEMPVCVPHVLWKTSIGVGRGRICGSLLSTCWMKFKLG